MVGADVALAALINRAGNVYLTARPAYITYREFTHAEGHGYVKELDRAVSVRVADNYAIMRDLPAGGEKTGPAFPVIPFFDPFSTFTFSYFANPGKIDITFSPGNPFIFPQLPNDPNVDLVVPYMSFYAPTYATDSHGDALHFSIAPTSRIGSGQFYPSDVRQDPTTLLPSHVTLQENGGDMTIGLDYGTIDGHWVITHGNWSATQHVLGMSIKVTAETKFEDIAFPETPPDARLASAPSPLPSASASP